MEDDFLERLIAFEKADLGYGRRVVLRSIDFDVLAGDFLGIVGPNGSGKTTLLKAVLGMIKPLSGRVHRASERIRFGYVPQRETVDLLYPLTVLDIVLMGRYALIGPFGRPGIADRQRAMSALEHVGIQDLAGRPYANLSGGQQQRTLIARALVGEPSLLVLDEPNTGMDLVGESATMELIHRLHVEDGIAVLMVTHQIATVVNYARRIAVVGEGVLREGTVAEMITSENLTQLYGIPVQVARVDSGTVVVPFPYRSDLK
jgi:ABC-type Mn2+/Zn2+ transport system ATPase subunit